MGASLYSASHNNLYVIHAHVKGFSLHQVWSFILSQILEKCVSIGFNNIDSNKTKTRWNK